MKNKYHWCWLLLACVAWSCTKDKDAVPQRPADYEHRIKFVLQDNYNFSMTTGFLQTAGLLDTLEGNGPYTFLAPVDQFYTNSMGIPDLVYAALYFKAPRLYATMSYHLIKGTVNLKSLALDIDTTLVAMNGSKLYVKKYLDNGDTLITINGAQILNADNVTANGNIQSISAMLVPDQYPTMQEMLQNEASFTMFMAAMQHAGLDSLLTSSNPYTILAPANTAFQTSGGMFADLDLTTMEGILEADPEKLAAVLKMHIMKGRYFSRDIYRLAAANGDSITMLDGSQVMVSGSIQTYHGIGFQATGNSFPVALFRDNANYDPSRAYADQPAHNGVLFKLGAFLIP
jgi:uncharacterized surface protein with fasciclin (FAS1) repeats